MCSRRVSVSQIDWKLPVRFPLSFNLGLLKPPMIKMSSTTCLVSKSKRLTVSIIFADFATLFTPHSFQSPPLRCPQILTLNQQSQHLSTSTTMPLSPTHRRHGWISQHLWTPLPISEELLAVSIIHFILTLSR